MVQCNTCGTKFEKYESTYNQAYGCSSEVHNGQIRGFYGSTVFDGKVGYWKNGQPSHVNDGNICDQCIRDVYDQIEVIGNNEFF